MTTKKEIAAMAKKVKETVEKEYKIPSKINNYNYAEYVYLFAKTIISPNKDYAKKSMETAADPHGTYISRTVYKSDYVKLAKNLISFMDNNNKAPNFISYNGYKITVKVYVDAFARVVNYYYTHQTMPSYVNVNSAAFTKPTITSDDEIFNYFVKKKIFL